MEGDGGVLVKGKEEGEEGREGSEIVVEAPKISHNLISHNISYRSPSIPFHQCGLPIHHHHHRQLLPFQELDSPPPPYLHILKQSITTNQITFSRAYLAIPFHLPRISHIHKTKRFPSYPSINQSFFLTH